jgi:hypothetical protein
MDDFINLHLYKTKPEQNEYQNFLQDFSRLSDIALPGNLWAIARNDYPADWLEIRQRQQ